MPAPLRLEIEDQVATVTLDRPPVNALNLELLTGLRDLLPRLRAPDVRAVVLRSAGTTFSAGLDLVEIGGYSEAEAAAFSEVFDEMMIGWFSLEIPMVAAICGHAIAGGLVLAALADFRLGAEGRGKLGLTEILVGVPFPASALTPVVSAFPSAVLPELLYRGTTFSMAEGLAQGLLHRLVAPLDLDAEALALARELGGRTRAGFSGTKRGLRAPALANLHAARPDGRDPVWGLWRSDEVQREISAYRARVLKRG